MSLAVSAEELAEFATLFIGAGITDFEMSYRGPRVIYAEANAAQALSALKLLQRRLKRIESYDARKQYLGRLEEAVKKAKTEAEKEAEREKDRPNIRH